MQVAEEAELESLLIQVAFEVEQERLHTKLGAAKSRAVADRQRGDEVSLRRACATRVRAQRRDELVGLDADVRGGKAKPPSHPVPRLDRPGHRVLTPKESVRLLELTRRDQPPHLRAVQLAAVDLEWRHDLDRVAVAAQPLGVTGAPAAEREVEADHPLADLHRDAQPIDEFLGRQRRQLPVEAKHDRVLDARLFDQGKLLLQGGDRLRAVRGIEHASGMWLERDQRGHAFHL